MIKNIRLGLIKKYYENKVKHALDNDVFTWSIFLKENNKVIGQITVMPDKNNMEICDIGWYIDPNYQRMGYATEAASTVIKYMFEEVKISKIISSAVKDNIPSCKLFEKLRFTKIGEENIESPYIFYDGILTFNEYELDN